MMRCCFVSLCASHLAGRHACTLSSECPNTMSPPPCTANTHLGLNLRDLLKNTHLPARLSSKALFVWDNLNTKLDWSERYAGCSLATWVKRRKWEDNDDRFDACVLWLCNRWGSAGASTSRHLCRYDNCQNSSEMASSQACGCKGIRSCALCENEGRKNRFADEASLAREIFHFCIDCGACYADGKEHKCGERSAVCLDGVKVYRDFVSPEEEERLVKAIDSDPWKPSQSGRLKQVNTPLCFFFFITTGSLVGLLLPVHMVRARTFPWFCSRQWAGKKFKKRPFIGMLPCLSKSSLLSSKRSLWGSLPSSKHMIFSWRNRRWVLHDLSYCNPGNFCWQLILALFVSSQS